MSKLAVSVRVYRKLDDRSYSSRAVLGRLPLDVFNECTLVLEDNDLLLLRDSQSREVEFNLPSLENDFFAKDLEELITPSKRRLDPPKSFYVADVDYYHRVNDSSGSPPDEIKWYIQAAKLARTLVKLSDHDTPHPQKKVYFLNNHKLELSLSYSRQDLCQLDGLDNFLAEFAESDIHREQKATIIKNVLLDMLKSNEINKFSLASILQRFQEFRERINANYQLYVSEFSFEKIKDQVERECFDFTMKLNKVFSDVQNQILAVPIALIIVGSQMESSVGLSPKNIALWLGSLVFGVFTSLLIRNQKSSLSAIKAEIDSQRETFRERHLFVEQKLGPIYEKLVFRYVWQRVFLAVISFTIAVSILISSWLLLYRSGVLDKLPETIAYGSVGGAAYVFASLFCWLIIRYSSGNIRRLSEYLSGLF